MSRNSLPTELGDQMFLVTGQRGFPDDYVTQVFFIWFNAGKPPPKGLQGLIEPVPGTDILPMVGVLMKWIDEDFVNRAVELDTQMVSRLTEETVASKVEMLKRHIELGKEMQDVALLYLKEHKDDMNANAAVRLLVEGVRIERESAGLPEALQKMISMSDEDLLKEIGDIMSKSPGRIEANT